MNYPPLTLKNGLLTTQLELSFDGSPHLNAVILIILLVAAASLPHNSFLPAVAQRTLEIFPSDDAYIVYDVNDPDDKQGFRSLNTGSLKFLKVWYAWNVTHAEKNEFVSFAYLKFDLSQISADKVASAKLRLYAQNITLTGASRLVDVHVASPSPWDESTLTYLNRPLFPNDPAASTSVRDLGWYEWNLADPVKQGAGSSLTVAVLLRTLFIHNEEQVVFSSKEAVDSSLRPELLIETSKTGFFAGDSTPIIAAAIVVGIAGAAFVAVIYRRRKQVDQSN